MEKGSLALLDVSEGPGDVPVPFVAEESGMDTSFAFPDIRSVSLVNCSHMIIADVLIAALLGLFCSTNTTYVVIIYALPLKLLHS